MLLIWRGWGIMTIPAALLGFSLAAAVFGDIGSNKTDSGSSYGVVLAMWAAAAMVYGLHVLLQRWAGTGTLTVKETGQQLTYARKHDLFWIPVRFWAFLLIGFGVVMLVSAVLSR